MKFIWVFYLSLVFFLAPIVLSVIDPLTSGVLQMYSIWAATIIGLLLFIGFLGKNICGQWTGVFIDSRFKYSLSRVQTLTWLILLGSAIYVITLQNMEWRNQPCQFVKGDPMMVDPTSENFQRLVTADGSRAFLQKADGCEYKAELLSADNSNSANEGKVYQVKSVKKATMEIDMKFLALMGLGLGTGLVSPLLRRRANAEGAFERVDLSLNNKVSGEVSIPGKAVIGNIVVNKRSEDAEFLDIFVGEKLDDAEQIDLYKVQMAFFSVIVYAVYLLLLNETFLINNGFFISQLPSIEDELLTLLLISHGGYLSGKVIGSSIGKPAPKVVQPVPIVEDAQQQLARQKEKLRHQRDTISAVANAARQRTQETNL
jgi:uncharacterized membrane protein